VQHHFGIARGNIAQIGEDRTFTQSHGARSVAYGDFACQREARAYLHQERDPGLYNAFVAAWRWHTPGDCLGGAPAKRRHFGTVPARVSAARSTEPHCLEFRSQRPGEICKPARPRRAKHMRHSAAMKYETDTLG
jgi:hypothetical protein